MLDDSITRRGVLRTVAAGGAATMGVGGAAAEEGPTRRIVGTASPRAERAARRRADSVKHVLDFGHIGTAVAGRFSDRAAEELSNRPDVRYVEADGEVETLAQTLPWGIDRVDADVLHDNGETGNGADVAIIDTGIDSDHYDLEGNLGAGRCFAEDCCGEAGGLFCSPNDNQCHHAWDDDNDHGTHCAGIADAVDDTEGVVGVSTEATLHAAKVLDGCGSGYYSDVAAGIEWTADQGYDVGSMSLGGDDSSTVQDACQYASDRGVLLVAAAGNDGPCSDCVGYPAAYDTVIAVSATSEDDSLADFSSTGPEVELAAPGEDILSTVPPESSSDGLDTFSGTSMACPHVSGAGGQLMANGDTNTEARQRLRDTAEDIGLDSNEQGYGLLDAEAAVLGSGDTSVAVSTGNATNVGETTATLNGSLDDLGGADSADCYFEYRESATSTWSTTAAQTLTSTGSFSEDVSGLSSGTEYEFRAVADASDGDSDAGATNTFTTSSSTGDNAPAIDQFELTDTSNPRWARVEVDWAVSDADGDLSDVTSAVTFANGGTASESSAVSGDSAAGTHKHRERDGHGDAEVTLTVTDSAGTNRSDTKTINLG
jgi:subtilisin